MQLDLVRIILTIALLGRSLVNWGLSLIKLWCGFTSLWWSLKLSILTAVCKGLKYMHSKIYVYTYKIYVGISLKPYFTQDWWSFLSTISFNIIFCAFFSCFWTLEHVYLQHHKTLCRLREWHASFVFFLFYTSMWKKCIKIWVSSCCQLNLKFWDGDSERERESPESIWKYRASCDGRQAGNKCV